MSSLLMQRTTQEKHKKDTKQIESTQDHPTSSIIIKHQSMNLLANLSISSPGGRKDEDFVFSQREHRRNRWSDPPSCCAHSAQPLQRVDVLAWATLVSKFQPFLDDFDIDHGFDHVC
jgi:hypothetical protein